MTARCPDASSSAIALTHRSISLLPVAGLVRFANPASHIFSVGVMTAFAVPAFHVSFARAGDAVKNSAQTVRKKIGLRQSILMR